MENKCNFGKIKNGCLLGVTVIAAVLMCTYAFQLSVPAILDETISMGDAAWITGRDWKFDCGSSGRAVFSICAKPSHGPLFCMDERSGNDLSGFYGIAGTFTCNNYSGSVCDLPQTSEDNI